MARVSVIIPAYNASKYICQAVEGVLAQSDPDVECIVVDDGSTDDTCERLAPYLGRIKYMYQSNRGRAVARNVGIDQAMGEYIAFLDADDYWDARKLERQIALFEWNHALGAVGSGAYTVQENGVIVRELQGAPYTTLPIGYAGFAQLITGDYTIAAPLSTLVFRKSCLDEVGHFDEHIDAMEEWDLLLRIVTKWQIGCVLEPLAFYRGYGLHVPSKYAHLNRQDQYISVVESAFARLPPLEQFAQLKQRAMAIAHFRGSLIDYAIGEIEAGARRLEKAKECSSNSFCSTESWWVSILSYFAAYLYDLLTPIEDSIDFIHTVFANLPSSLGHLKSSSRKALAKTCLIHVFGSYPRNDWHTIRRAGYCAVLYDLRVLRNRGFLSILSEATVGPGPTRTMRNLARMLRL